MHINFFTYRTDSTKSATNVTCAQTLYCTYQRFTDKKNKICNLDPTQPARRQKSLTKPDPTQPNPSQPNPIHGRTDPCPSLRQRMHLSATLPGEARAGTRPSPSASIQRLSVPTQRYNAILLHDCFVKEQEEE